MKIPFYIGTLIATLILAITILLAFDKTIPPEFLVSLTGLITFFVGLLSNNPTHGEEQK